VLSWILAEEQNSNLLGDDFFAWVVLALGGALLVGNVMALVRPPDRSKQRKGDLQAAPVGRSVVMAGIGAVATLWALATLIAG
jgi:hypothetical protein